VESNSAPWRVFDTPAAEKAGAPGKGAADAAASSGLPIQPVALLGLLGAFALGIVAIVIAAGSMGSDRVVDGPGTGSSVASSGPGSAADLLVVDVAGAVVSPGLYRLAPGSRVGDAVEAAGGYGPRVDVERVAAELNLAATLTDGARIRVPSRDDPAGGTAGSSGGGEGGQGAGAAGAIDLNKASESELESLPGIGPVTAAKIIAARDQAPFRSIDELRERGLVGEKTFDSLKALITVG
jgi:competence protein ComEA